MHCYSMQQRIATSRVYSLGHIMEMKIELRQEYVYVVFSGPYDFRSALAQFKQAAAASVQSQLSRVLMDMAAVTGEISIVDLHDLAVELSSQKAVTRAAMVARKDQLLPDRFMENVARNRGLPGRGFLDFCEAEKWLLNKPQ